MNILLDTDIDTDCDDAGALAVLHALQTQGAATLLGVICSVPQRSCASCVWAINRAYGRGDIPIGLIRAPGWAENPRHELYRQHREGALSRRKGAPFYNDVVTRALAVPVPPSVYDGALRQYRRLLSGAPDGSVTVCAVGTLTALAQLIESGPDDISRLSGRDLVARKVRKLVTMAEVVHPSGREVFNWRMDLVAAARVVSEWPVDLVVSGLGRDVLTGSRFMKSTPPDHPVNLAYRTYLGDTDANRSSWDQLAVLYAVLGTSSLFAENWETGLRLDPATGTHEWGGTGNGPRRGYLSALVPPAVLARRVEDLMIESAAAS